MIRYFFKWLFMLPEFFCYIVYDKISYWYFNKQQLFNGWGIHLLTGRFGASKTISVVNLVHEAALMYPDITIITNIELKNFPPWVRIKHLDTIDDILNAPANSIIIIDEIGTIFNSRDFMKGGSIPKPLFQVICQIRKKRIMIYGTVQRYNLLDKQIRDVSATVTCCESHFEHPFSRRVILTQFDIDEFEMYCSNPTYKPRVMSKDTFIQTNQLRASYDTLSLVTNLLDSEYVSDAEVLANRGELQGVFAVLDKKQNKQIRRRSRF